MSDAKTLEPIEEKQVLFYDDQVMAVAVQEGEKKRVYVPIRPLCTLLGISWGSQRNRIDRDPVLIKKKRGVFVTNTPQGGGRQEMTCLPLEYLNGWLFGINANRVKPEIRDRLLRYQEECYLVLAEAFREGRLTSDPAFSDLIESDSPAAQAYKIARAMMELARNQLVLESRLGVHDTRLDKHEERLEEIESTLGDTGRHVTPDQASQISQAVKTVAMVLSKASGSNQYGSVYGELYRKFGVTSYKLLPAHRFEEAMRFLSDWHQDLVGDSPF